MFKASFSIIRKLINTEIVYILFNSTNEVTQEKNIARLDSTFHRKTFLQGFLSQTAKLIWEFFSYKQSLDQTIDSRKGLGDLLPYYAYM